MTYSDFEHLGPHAAKFRRQVTERPFEDKLPADAADRRVYWAGNILLRQAMETGKAALRYDDLDIEVELLKMEEDRES
jgi:hypothetical protein